MSLTPARKNSPSPEDNSRLLSRNRWAGKSLKELSSHRPPVSQIVTGKVGGLYSDWADDSTSEMHVDPSIYDQDFDDVSEAGSDFTDDYSRHRLEDHDFGIWASFEDDDDESWSTAGSFTGEMDEEDWSQSSVSSADSRKLIREAGHSVSFDEGLLSHDPSEFSLEEDPLFNAGGTLRFSTSDQDQNVESWMPPLSHQPPNGRSVALSISDVRKTNTEQTSTNHLPRMYIQPVTRWQESQVSQADKSSIETTTSAGEQENARMWQSAESAVDTEVDQNLNHATKKVHRGLRGGTNERTPTQLAEPNMPMIVDPHVTGPLVSQIPTLDEPIIIETAAADPNTGQFRVPASIEAPDADPENSRMPAEADEPTIAETAAVDPGVSHTLVPAETDESATTEMAAVAPDFSKTLTLVETDKSTTVEASLANTGVARRFSAAENDDDIAVEKPSTGSVVSEMVTRTKIDQTTTVEFPTADRRVSTMVTQGETHQSPAAEPPVAGPDKKPRLSPMASEVKSGFQEIEENLTVVESSYAGVGTNETHAVSGSKVERRKAAPGRTRSTKAQDTEAKAIKNKASISVKKSAKRVPKKNPIVPTPPAELEKIPFAREESSTTDHIVGAFNTMLDYLVDFTHVRFSPIELRAALKDHSMLPSKSHKSPKKRNTNKATKSPHLESEIEAETDHDLSSNGDVSETYNSTKDDQKKAKKSGKKKAKKQKIRKRGRRAEYEGTMTLESMVEPQKLFGSTSDVAHRVEAIFANKHIIFGANAPPEFVMKNEQGSDTPDTINVKIKPSKTKAVADRNESKVTPRLVRRSVSMGGVGITITKARQNRSKSREPLLSSSSVTKDVAPSTNASRRRSKSVDVSNFDTMLRRKEKKHGSQPPMYVSSKRDATSKKNGLVKNGKAVKGKSPKSSSQPSPSTALRLSDIIDDDDNVCAPESRFERNLDEADSSKATSSSSHFSFDGMVVEGPLSAMDPELVKANIAIITEQVSALESQTRNEIQAMRENLEGMKVALESKLISEKHKTNAVNAILLLHKDAVKDLRISSRALKKQLNSLQDEMSSEISTLSLLSQQAMALQAQKAAVLNVIQRQEIEMLSHTSELEKCQREQQRILQLSGEQHSHNSIVIGGFDDYIQETQIPLFRSWENPSPAHRVRNDFLAASFTLPKTSIFFDVLLDPEHRVTFFSK